MNPSVLCCGCRLSHCSLAAVWLLTAAQLSRVCVCVQQLQRTWRAALCLLSAGLSLCLSACSPHCTDGANEPPPLTAAEMWSGSWLQLPVSSFFSSLFKNQTLHPPPSIRLLSLHVFFQVCKCKCLSKWNDSVIEKAGRFWFQHKWINPDLQVDYKRINL